jgi:hypothetical protein
MAEALVFVHGARILRCWMHGMGGRRWLMRLRIVTSGLELESGPGTVYASPTTFLGHFEPVRPSPIKEGSEAR